MHSSRMRTVRNSSRLEEGVPAPGGVPAPRGVPAPWGVCSCGGLLPEGGFPACTEADPPLWTE